MSRCSRSPSATPTRRTPSRGPGRDLAREYQFNSKKKCRTLSLENHSQLYDSVCCHKSCPLAWWVTTQTVTQTCCNVTRLFFPQRVTLLHGCDLLIIFLDKSVATRNLLSLYQKFSHKSVAKHLMPCSGIIALIVSNLFILHSIALLFQWCSF